MQINRLCKLRRATTALPPVVRRLDNAIHRTNHNPVDKCQRTKLCTLSAGKWKVIYPVEYIKRYPVDSVIHVLNNPDLGFYTVKRNKGKHASASSPIAVING